MSGWPFSKREVYPTDAELAEYLARLRDGYDQDIMGEKKYSGKKYNPCGCTIFLNYGQMI